MSASRRLSAISDSRSRAPSLSGPGVGQEVEVQGNRGIVRFSGTTEFASGRWLGIELEERQGKNDGSVQGKRYFECPPDHGVFVRSSQVKSLSSLGETSTTGVSSSNISSRSLIHGAEIQQGAAAASESRLRPPVSATSPSAAAAGPDALRNARRTSALPGRLAAPSSGPAAGSPATPTGLPPAGSSRLSESFLQQRHMGSGQTPTEGSAISSGQSRRITDAHAMAARRISLTGMKSPTPSGIRSSSRQTAASDSGSAVSRPASREYANAPGLSTEALSSPHIYSASDSSTSRDAARQSQQKTQSSNPGSRRDGDAAESRMEYNAHDAVPDTPTSKPPPGSSAEEVPRTPYRPALSMNESSTYDMQTPGASTMGLQTVPMKQYEELRLKYRYLELKRSEDRQRLQEADGIRAEAEQAVRVRDKLAAKVTAQQEDIRALKTKVKEIGAERERTEASYSEAMDMVEMLSVDKEMAEEKAESLAQEISAMREQLDEASTNLDVYRQEGGDHSAVLSSGDRNSATVLEFTQLQKQNERLKEALVRLRDVTTENESQLNQKIKVLEREVQTVQELADENGTLKENIAVRDSQIEDLKERLDDSFGAEEMIEDLSERNLTLSGKVEELQSTVESLEALCEVNNEMDEARTEEMQGLRAEIDKLNVVANDKNRSIDKLEEAVAVFQYNIGQYRDLVSSLQSDVQRLREREQAQATEAATVSSRTQEMESLSLQLRSTILKTKAKTIDLEMRRLEADQATEQLHMTAPFLPDHFYRSENEALKALLAFKRLEAKGSILCTQLEQEEKTDAAISDSFVATAEIRTLLAQLSGYAGLFVSFLSTCSASEFMRLGSLLHDTQGIERRLNGLIDLLRNEEFRASETLPEIRRLASQVLGLADAHVPVDSQATAGPRLGIMVARLAYGSDVQVANLFYIEQLLVSGPAVAAEDDEAVVIPFTKRDQQRIADDVLPVVANVVQSCRACKAVAIKLLRRSDDLVRAGSVLSGRALEQFAQLVQTNRELSDYCVRSRTVIQDFFATAAAAAAQAAEDDTERAPVSLGRLLQDVNGIAHDVFGASDAVPMGLALGASQRLGKELGVALASIGDSNNVCKIEAAEAPWIRRAKHFKASLVQNADVQRRTEALNEEIISLARELKVRDQAIQEYSVKTEMLGKRADVARKQADQMREMQRELENKRSDLDAYEGATAVLEDEIRRLKHEKKKLLEQHQQQATSRAAAAAAGGAMAYDDDYSTLGVTAARLPTDLLGLRSKITRLQESVAYLRTENAHMRAKYQFKEEMHMLTAEPLLVNGPLQEGSSEIGVVVREARAAAMEARRLAAMPKLVRLAAAHGGNNSSNRAVAVWQPQSSRPQFDLYRQQTLAQALKQRAESVQDRLRSIARSSYGGLPAVHLAAD